MMQIQLKTLDACGTIKTLMKEAQEDMQLPDFNIIGSKLKSHIIAERSICKWSYIIEQMEDQIFLYLIFLFQNGALYLRNLRIVQGGHWRAVVTQVSSNLSVRGHLKIDM